MVKVTPKNVNRRYFSAFTINKEKISNNELRQTNPPVFNTKYFNL